MRKWLIGLISIIILLLWFGGDIYEVVRDIPNGNLITEENEGNYNVTLESKKEAYSVGEELKVWATIQYNGLKPFTRVYYASSFFSVTVRGLDNDFKQILPTALVLQSSYLYRNVSIFEEFNFLDLSPGEYKISALANFAETDNYTEFEFSIPVSLVIEITE